MHFFMRIGGRETLHKLRRRRRFGSFIRRRHCMGMPSDGSSKVCAWSAGNSYVKNKGIEGQFFYEQRLQNLPKHLSRSLFIPPLRRLWHSGGREGSNFHTKSFLTMRRAAGARCVVTPRGDPSMWFRRPTKHD